MNITGKIHCLFEQTGTFKNEFQKLGYEAYDYDISDSFFQTDFQIDLFTEIKKAYFGGESIFDTFMKNDLLLVFFPCTYFSAQNSMIFCGNTYQQQHKNRQLAIREILHRSEQREYYYRLAIKLFAVVERLGLRMIFENPAGLNHYLNDNFPWRPTFVDRNRRLRGDYYIKPTQYWFINCIPTAGCTLQPPKEKKVIRKEHNEVRSTMSPEYARNFICDFIIGKPQPHVQPVLFEHFNDDELPF